MSVERFVGLLWVYAASATEEKDRKAALHLHYNMVQFELMPDWRKKLRPRKPVVRFRTRKERVRTLRSGGSLTSTLTFGSDD